MLRSIAVGALVLSGCCPCGPPGEPLIDFTVRVEVPISDGQYLHAAMYNAAGEFVTAAENTAVSTWRYSLGNCDGYPQQSGPFKILAWLNWSYAYYEEAPAARDLQAMDLVDVTCSNDRGCYPAREVHITIR